jgi:hypothetical protein
MDRFHSQQNSGSKHVTRCLPGFNYDKSASGWVGACSAGGVMKVLIHNQSTRESPAV